jgi:hypothetical protein
LRREKESSHGLDLESHPARGDACRNNAVGADRRGYVASKIEPDGPGLALAVVKAGAVVQIAISRLTGFA